MSDSGDVVVTFFGEEVQRPEWLTRQWFLRHFPFSVVGAFLFIANFPNLLTRAIDARAPDGMLRTVLLAPIQGVRFILGTIIGPDTAGFFERSMACSFFLIFVFLALLALFSLRRRSIRMFAYGFGGIVAGVLALHALAYGALVGLVVAKFLIMIAAFIIQIIQAILYFVVQIIQAILYFLFHYLWPVLLAVTVIGCVLFLISGWQNFLAFLRFALLVMRRNAGKLLALAVIGWAIYLFFPLIYRWIIAPIIAFLKWILPYIEQVVVWIVGVIAIVIACVLGVFLLFTALAFIGSLAVTQLQAGWFAARSHSHVLKAGIALGAALALIVLVSAGTPALAAALDQSWYDAFAFVGIASRHAASQDVATAFAYFLPEAVRQFAYSYLTNLQAPGLDSFLLLLTACVASLSVMFRLFSSRSVEDEYVPIRLLANEYAEMMVGVFALLFLIFGAALSGDSKG